MKWLDELAENTAVALEGARTSRRSVIAGLGSLLLGAGAVPLLPVARGADTKPSGAVPGAGTPNADPGDPASCEYWRHCAVDGFLCGCCGGSQIDLPAGHRHVPGHLDRHLPQSWRRQGLRNFL